MAYNAVRDTPMTPHGGNIVQFLYFFKTIIIFLLGLLHPGKVFLTVFKGTILVYTPLASIIHLTTVRCDYVYSYIM